MYCKSTYETAHDLACGCTGLGYLGWQDANRIGSNCAASCKVVSTGAATIEAILSFVGAFAEHFDNVNDF
jgi:hypothetical protein